MGIKAGEDTFYQAQRGIVQDGLVLNLDAGVDESYSRGTVWRDLKGGNNGTLINEPTFDRDNGGSIVFDGSDDRVEFTNLGLSYSDFSFQAMVKVRSNNGGYNCIMSSTLGSNNDYSYGFNLDLSSGSSGSVSAMNLEISRNFGGFYNRDVLTTTIPFHTWVNIAFSVDSIGNNYKVYVNGVQDYTNTYGGSITHFDRVTIGQRFYSGAYNGSSCFHGDIATSLIYNRALTAAEVLQNYNATRHRFGV
jgi:hypothetical protein